MARELLLQFFVNHFPRGSYHVRNKTVSQKNAEIQNN
jgi:hypothetical protein